MPKINRSATAAPADASTIKQWVSELLTAKKQVKFFKSRQDEVTGRIKAVVEEQGYQDDQGHIWLDLDEPVDGVPKLQMQRKVSQPLQEEKAEAILKKKGLWESCTTTVTVIDQDAIMAAHFEGAISEDEIDAMFPKVVNYALMTPTAK